MEDNKEVIKLVLDELANRGFLNNSGQTFKDTEKLLFTINKIKASIKDKEEEIRDLQNYGTKSKSKSITSFGGNISMNKPDEEEIIEETIRSIKKEILRTTIALNHITRAINKLSNDKYYDIITYKYIDGLGLEEIVEIYDSKGIKTTVSTLSKNKNRLVNELRISLFTNEFIFELFNINAEDKTTKKEKPKKKSVN